MSNPTSNTPDSTEIQPGDNVSFQGINGIARYIGKTEFAAGEWCGIELAKPIGKNDGTVQGHRYFTCPDKHGMFVRLSNVTFVSRNVEKVKKPVKARTSDINLAPLPPLATPARPARPSVTPTSSRKSMENLPDVKELSRPKLSSLAEARRQSLLGHKPSSPKESPKLEESSKEESTEEIQTGKTEPEPQVTSQPSLPETPVKPPIFVFNTPKPSLPATPATRPVFFADLMKPQSTTPLVKESKDSTTPEKPPSLPDIPVTPVPATPKNVSNTPRSLMTPSGRGVQIAQQLREIEELKIKVRSLERQRAEDKERLLETERLKSDAQVRSFEKQKLNDKVADLHNTIAKMRTEMRQLSDEMEQVKRQKQEALDSMELVNLDKEVAEEKAAALQLEVDLWKDRVEELEIELDVVKGEQELAQVSTQDSVSQQATIFSLTKQNERLKDALIKLRDVSESKETELRKKVQSLEQESTRGGDWKNKADLLNVELENLKIVNQELQQRLEDATSSEDLILELTEKNLAQNERLEELTATITELQALRELAEELELAHAETEDQLMAEIEDRDLLIAEQDEQISSLSTALADRQVMVERLRDKLQDLQGYVSNGRKMPDIDRAIQEKASESPRAVNRHDSQHVLTLSHKLQAKSQELRNKTIDLQICRLELIQAREILDIYTDCIPALIMADVPAIESLFLLKRLACKANLLSRTCFSGKKPYTTEGEAILHEASVLCTSLESNCLILATMMQHCNHKEFVELGQKVIELSGMEKRLDNWIEQSKVEVENKNDLVNGVAKMVQHVVQLHRKVDTPILYKTILRHGTDSLISSLEYVEGTLMTISSEDFGNVVEKMGQVMNQSHRLRKLVGKLESNWIECNLQELEKDKEKLIEFSRLARPLLFNPNANWMDIVNACFSSQGIEGLYGVLQSTSLKIQKLLDSNICPLPKQTWTMPWSETIASLQNQGEHVNKLQDSLVSLSGEVSMLKLSLRKKEEELQEHLVKEEVLETRLNTLKRNQEADETWNAKVKEHERREQELKRELETIRMEMERLNVSSGQTIQTVVDDSGLNSFKSMAQELKMENIRLRGLLTQLNDNAWLIDSSDPIVQLGKRDSQENEVKRMEKEVENLVNLSRLEASNVTVVTIPHPVKGWKSKKLEPIVQKQDYVAKVQALRRRKLALQAQMDKVFAEYIVRGTMVKDCNDATLIARVHLPGPGENRSLNVTSNEFKAIHHVFVQ